jgi:hypothetical protein
MNYSITLGLYPGILIGSRSYDFNHSTMYVLYVPFIQLMLEIYHEDVEYDE